MRFPSGNWGPDGLSTDERHPLVRITVNGEQVLESTPVELPIGTTIPEPLEVTLARMVRDEISRTAVAAGHESLDEAYDFDTADDDSYEEHLTDAEIHAMMHAPEMKPEFPKESANVRERAGSGKGASSQSGDGVSVGDDRVPSGGQAQYAGNGKGMRREDEAVRVRVSADAGSGSRVGKGGESARVAADDES